VRGFVLGFILAFVFLAAIGKAKGGSSRYLVGGFPKLSAFIVMRGAGA
jgi:hypothetical protein